jgi:hypothetical protein
MQTRTGVPQRILLKTKSKNEALNRSAHGGVSGTRLANLAGTCVCASDRKGVYSNQSPVQKRSSCWHPRASRARFLYLPTEFGYEIALCQVSQREDAQRPICKVDEWLLTLKGDIMPCTREPVRMSGILSGGGLKTYCTVSALRVTLSGTRMFRDCGYSILWIANPLPDGNYKLLVEGATVDLHYSKGSWHPTGA